MAAGHSGLAADKTVSDESRALTRQIPALIDRETVPAGRDQDMQEMRLGEDGVSALASAGYRVCEGELQKITGGSRAAEQALESGRVRITQIPTALMTEDALHERVAWLESWTPK